MSVEDKIRETPWDRRAFSIPTYEITEPCAETLAHAARTPGHFCVKIDPLADKRLLTEHGFYYCDTLLEPYCAKLRFTGFDDPRASVTREVGVAECLEISHGAYEHGRFHRDFNLPRELSDLRYDRWTEDLCAQGNCFGLLYDGKLAGYFGYAGSHIVLHAVAAEFRGRGLAKYLWSAACRELYAQGHPELSSSVSAGNIPVVNLYASLGFRFRNPLDVYHRYNPLP